MLDFGLPINIWFSDRHGFLTMIHMLDTRFPTFNNSYFVGKYNVEIQHSIIVTLLVNTMLQTLNVQGQTLEFHRAKA